MVGLSRHLSTARASGESPEASPASSMSIDEAYDILGVKDGAGFDEILTAKNKLSRASEEDRDRAVRV